MPNNRSNSNSGLIAHNDRKAVSYSHLISTACRSLPIRLNFEGKIVLRYEIYKHVIYQNTQKTFTLKRDGGL